MRFFFPALICSGVLGCGDNLQPPGVDAHVEPMLVVSGAVTRRDGFPPVTNPFPGVMVEAYTHDSDATPVASVIADDQGQFLLQIPSNGEALDGYLKATITGYVDTYLYPSKPITSDLSTSLNLLTPAQVDLLSGVLCASAQEATNGLVAVLVADANKTPVAGATISTSPTAPKYCYDSGGYANKTATATDPDGLSFAINVAAGEVTVSAEASDMTFVSHKLTARAGTFTTTVIQP